MSRPIDLQVADLVIESIDQFVEWPAAALLLWPGQLRQQYHNYPPEVLDVLAGASVQPNTLSNGPAICAYLVAGGERPELNGRGWDIHHVYDGEFPLPGQEAPLHAAQHGEHFTQSAGLVAIHPIAHKLAHTIPYFEWHLRREALLRFGYDPDGVANNLVD